MTPRTARPHHAAQPVRRPAIARQDQGGNHLRPAAGRQPRGVGLGIDRLRGSAGTARDRVPRVPVRPAARLRCGSYRRHRQRRPQAHAARQGALCGRLLLLARTLHHRRGGLHCDRHDGNRPARPARCAPRHRWRHRHDGLGTVPADHRPRQSVHPARRLGGVHRRPSRRAASRRGARRPAGGWRPADPVVPSSVSCRIALVAHVSDRFPVRPRVRYRDGNRPARHIGDPGRTRHVLSGRSWCFPRCSPPACRCWIPPTAW